eukprot:3199624-Rhodomonas_salina.1
MEWWCCHVVECCWELGESPCKRRSGLGEAGDVKWAWLCHHEGRDVWGAVKDWAVVVVGVVHCAVKVPEYGGTRGIRWRRCDWIAVVSVAENA